MNYHSKHSVRVISHRRPAFTLVELLVAMAIFSILGVLAISGFRETDSDRISSATATLRNALEGARSRAIKSGQIRGLRLIRDANDSNFITSLVYIGPPEEGYDEGDGILKYTDGKWQLKPSTMSDWENLHDRGLLSTPTRVELPRGSGKWYPVTGIDGNFATLGGHYQPSQPDVTTGYIAIPPETPIPYRIELAPTILPGAETILLPRNTCIDVVGSILPDSGDILFDPRGFCAGDALTKKILHFVIASPSDLATTTPRDTSSGTVYATLPKGQRLVSVFAQTGGILISEIDPTDEDKNGLADDPYSLAISGQEAR